MQDITQYEDRAKRGLSEISELMAQVRDPNFREKIISPSTHYFEDAQDGCRLWRESQYASWASLVNLSLQMGESNLQQIREYIKTYGGPENIVAIG